MRYQAAVQKNLRHMGTPASEWSAVPVVGVEQVEGDRPAAMPVFDFPKNYTRAPTMFTGNCCELCGTNIKNHYWIMHPGKCWLLTVGSECVTHFGEGASGATLAKEAQQSRNHALVVGLRKMRGILWRAYSRRLNEGYGRYRYDFSRHSHSAREADRLHEAMGKLLGQTRGDSGNSAISRWANRNREAGTALFEEARQLVEADTSLPGEIREKVRLLNDLQPPSSAMLEALTGQAAGPAEVAVDPTPSPQQELLL